MKVSELIDTSYRNFSFYTIENRAIPSMMDGFKPVQRMLFYTMMNTKKNQEYKVSDIAGRLAGYGYKHGDVSAQDAMVRMCAPHLNNVPVFTPHGSFGSRMTHAAAAARYIYVSQSEIMHKMFSDHSVLESQDDSPVPKFYAPNIPWLLVNGSVGIAVGFACKILPRRLDDVVAFTKAVVKGQKKLPDLPPSFPGFKGTVESSVVDGKLKHVFTGTHTYKIRGRVAHITELPPSTERSEYVKLLAAARDEEIIESFTENCGEHGFEFTVVIAKEYVEKYKAYPDKFLGLVETHVENFTTIGTDGKLKIFDNPEELVRAWVSERIDIAEHARLIELDNLFDECVWLKCKALFCSAVSEDSLSITRRSKTELVLDIRDYFHGEDTCWTTEICERLIGLPISSITMEEAQKARDDLKAAAAKHQKMSEMTAKEIMLERLKNY